MGYKGTQLAGMIIVAGLMTAGVLWGLADLLDAPVLQEFFFGRSKVQWATLGVFMFILCVLAHRLVQHRHMWFCIRRLSDSSQDESVELPGAIAERWHRVRACKTQCGRRAAVQCNQDLAQEDETALERIYGLLGNAMQLMLALGFFGTVWGISQSMAGSFENLAGGNPDDLKRGLESFTSSLGIALDTTLLAISGSLVASVLSTGMNWVEMNRLEYLEKVIASVFALETVAPTPEAEIVQVVKTELSLLAEPLLNQMESAMESMVDKACQSLELKLTEAVEQPLLILREKDDQLGDRVTETIQDQASLAIHAMEEQHRLLRNEMAAALQGLTAHLGRAPEVSIRYPNLNGSKPEPDSVHEVPV